MTPVEKAFIDAHVDIFASCKDCFARVSSFSRNAYLPLKVEALELKRTYTHVICTIGLDQRYREQIAPSASTAKHNVWKGLCSCRRRWSYTMPDVHGPVGQLKVALRPEPAPAEPAADAPKTAPPKTAAERAPAVIHPVVPHPPKIAQGKSESAQPRLVNAAAQAPTGAEQMPTVGGLRARAGTRLSFVDDEAKREAYFATMYRHERPIQTTLSHRKGSFIVVLEPKKSSHKHPFPLDRPELQNMRARAFDVAPLRRKRPALLEIPTEYFDESVLHGLCCLDVSVLVSACGCLYRPLSPSSYDVETPGGFSKGMPNVYHRRGQDPEELRLLAYQEFPGVLNHPPRNTQKSGVFEGRSTDALASLGLGRYPVILAVEWSTLNYTPEHCPNGKKHPPMMQRPGVRDWIRHSDGTTGFVTKDKEPMLIAMRAAPSLLDEELCCLSVRILVPSTGTSLHQFAPGKVRWETR